MIRLVGMAAVLALVAACHGGFDVSQAPECKAYVTCFELTGGTKGSLDSSYGAMGTCWSTTYARLDECARECIALGAARRNVFPDAGCKEK